jgi:GT2 family glycosyltransferase
MYDPVNDTTRRRLRLIFLQTAVAVSDALCDFLRRRRPPTLPAYSRTIESGISVIIPERGKPPILEETLQAALEAAARLPEPSEVVVVVDGGRAEDYDDIAARFPSVKWLFAEESSGFAKAVARGLEAAQHPWVYLLNNDMVLDGNALVEIARWRAPHVFALTSQIFFRDADKRREETGWSQFRIQAGCLETFDVVPEDDHTVRGSFYPGGGSSLFQKRLLREIMGAGDPYHPFYWEDAEWGTVAWKMGYEVLACPASKAWHCHRATVSQFYSAAEVERIFQRNAIRFHLRNLRNLGSFESLCSKIMALDPVSFWEIVGKKNVLEVFRARVRCTRFPFDDSCLENLAARYYLKPAVERNRRSVLFVSPFAISPPSHGGAIRMHRLLQNLSREFDVTVLSDEKEAYSQASLRYFEGMSAVHLVGGRKEKPEDMHTRTGRMNSHCHPALRRELHRRIAADHPDVVQIEFMELAGLIESGPKNVPWAITLHEVTLSDHSPGATEEDVREMGLIEKYDAAIACSLEDANLLKEPGKAWIVPNGMDLGAIEYASSEASKAILFLGPFRYKPNFDGIRAFLDTVYPRLLEKIPDLQAWLLGGHGAVDTAAGISSFNRPGVTVYDFLPDPRPFLRRCALTINPLVGSRGSSLKLIESIAAGRVCVSTTEGARGFAEAGFPSLIIRDTIDDFYEPLVKLLSDPACRVGLEKPDLARIEQFSWAASARRQGEVYRSLLSM